MLDLIAYTLVRIAAFLCQCLPVKVSLFFARCFGWFLALLGIRFKRVYANLKIAFGNQYSGPELKKIIRQNYMNLAQNFVEILYFPKMNQAYSDKHVVEYRREIYDACIAKRTKGVVFLTAHFGNWELLSLWGCFQGFPIYVVVKDQKLKRLENFLTKLRECHGSKMIRKGAGVKAILRALSRENGLLGILGDQSGGKEGVPVRFFGRKTTAPQGIIEIAYRTGSIIQTSFLVREKGSQHRIYFEEPIEVVKTDDVKKDIEKYTQQYMDYLQKYITQFPEQWLWFFKRWKYNWTKNIVVLSDGKPGHEVQSRAIAQMIKDLDELDERFEFKLDTVQIRYKSKWAKRMFSLFSLILLPWSQGRMHVLKAFLEKESYEQLVQTAPDLVVSCGFSVLPLNFILKKEFQVKNIVLMKRPFPFNLMKPDLSLIPEHDRVKESKGVLLTRVAPNLVDSEQLKIDGELLRQELNLDHQKVVSVFLGGKTKGYDFSPQFFKQFVEGLDRFVHKNNCKLIITTSRRTSKQYEKVLKDKFEKHPEVPLLVIANEDNPEGIARKMMGVSDVILVSEDSVSMISEGVASGKDVLILKMNSKGLASKHYRFQKHLQKQGVLRVVNPFDVEKELDVEMNQRRTRLIYDDKKKISESLRALL